MERFVRTRSILSISLVFFVTASPLVGRAEVDKSVATVNGKVITQDYFNRKFNENARYLNLQTPTKKSFLDDLIRRELGLQEARKLGIDKDPSVVERMETVLYQSLIEKKLSGEFEKINVSDDQAKSFYDRNPEIRTSHIFVNVPAGASKAEEAKAMERIKKVRDQHLRTEKMSFAEAAQRFSEGPEAAMGGDMDYQTKDRLEPSYYAAAVKLGKVGNVSDIIRTRFGFHLIKLTGINAWEQVDKPRIKRIVFDERRKQIFDNYMESLRKQAKVAVRSELLAD